MLSKKVYLCGCEWLYVACFGYFWGFMVDYKAIAMVPFLPLGRATIALFF